jgi:NADPH:quinone reductase-like Zn-dependent oxidoreductase
MQAIVLKGFGGIEHLSLTTLPIPAPAEREVLVEVRSLSINPVDAKTRAGRGMAGRLKTEDPLILGWDISGAVRESRSPDFQVGDEVFGMVRFPGHGKAYAGFVTAPDGHLAKKPAGTTHNEAAAATLAALTAWQGLVHHGHVAPGQRVLIHAAAGGVGHYAVQVAKHLGAYVIGTASAANREFVLGLGADEHIDYKTQRLADTVRGVDLVLDTIGGDNIDQSLPVIRKGGAIISIPSGLNETVVEKAKAMGVNGSFFLVQSSGEDMRQIATLLETGTLKSHVSQVFPFAEMGQAHLQIASGRTRGKIALEL